MSQHSTKTPYRGASADSPPKRGALTLTVVAAVLTAAWAVSHLGHVPSSEATYRNTVRTVWGAPEWVQKGLEIAGEVGVAGLGLLLLTLAWRSRARGIEALARHLLVGAAAVVAYATSEVTKLLITQPRPCATLDVTAIASCPGAGDWSLPSNHATIAGALATAVCLVAPRWALPAALSAVVVAFARVGVGVHFPHDVLTGLVLGSSVVALAAVLLDQPARTALHALAGRWPAIVRR